MINSAISLICADGKPSLMSPECSLHIKSREVRETQRNKYIYNESRPHNLLYLYTLLYNKLWGRPSLYIYLLYSQRYAYCEDERTNLTLMCSMSLHYIIQKTLNTNECTKSFFVNYNTLLHVSTLLGHLQGETFRCHYTRLHFIVEWEYAVDCTQ
jgi:hypothetical protein